MSGAPPFVVVGGVTASGKTSVARELARQLDAHFFDADDFHSEASKAKMGRGEGLSDEDRWPWLERLARLGTEEDGAVVLACSALRRTYRALLLGARPNARLFLLLVSREEAERRANARQGHYAKASLLDTQFATLELPAEGAEPGVETVDGDAPLSVIVQHIRERVEER